MNKYLKVNAACRNNLLQAASGKLMIHVYLEPEMQWMTAKKCKSVHGVLNRLQLEADQVLVIDEKDCLLTPDRLLSPGAKIRIRKVGSRG